jgi:hypothetical protein
LLVLSKFPGKIDMTLQGATDERKCVEAPDLFDFCYQKLQSSLQSGLNKIADEYSMPGQYTYAGSFDFVELQHMPAAVYAGGGVAAARLQMKWRFVLRDQEGTVLVALAETTVGDKAMASRFAGDDALGSLINQVLEQVGQLMQAAAEKAQSDTPQVPQPPPIL